MPERIGRQDPTTAIILPYQDTNGPIAVKLYELSRKKALPWQQALVYDILAVDEFGRYVHSKFGYEVPRRNGKGEVILIRELYGLAIGERILHTAHRTSTSHSAWERMCTVLDEIGVEYTAIKAKGQEYIDLEDGGHIEFRTRTAKGGLGEGFDLLVIDEAQEYQDDQESTLKYVVTDSKNGQTILCGTPPTPISSGTVFKKMREEVLQGTWHTLGWAEWSVDKMTDPEDREAWYETNPSLGLTLKESDVADEVSQEDEKKVDFNIQRLGLWITYELKSAISRAVWDGGREKGLPKLTGKMCIGIKYAADSMTVSMAVAVRTEDGRVFFEVVKRGIVRDGNDWIVAFVRTAGKNIGKIVIDGKNGQEILKKDLKDGGVKMAPVEVTSSDNKVDKYAEAYDEWTFDDGTVLKTVNQHRFYNIEKGCFAYLKQYGNVLGYEDGEWEVGNHGLKADGSRPALVSYRRVEGVCKHHTIFTDESDGSYYANGLLSGNRHSRRVGVK